MATTMADAVVQLSEAIGRGTELLDRLDARERKREQAADRLEPLRRQPKQLRRLDLAVMAQAVPGLLAQFAAEVPGQFWAQSGPQEATVACPCGTDAIVPLGIPTECACERFFLYTGRQVRAARYEPVDSGQANS